MVALWRRGVGVNFFFANYVKRDIDSRGGQDGDHIKSFSSLLLFFSFPPYPTRSLLEPWEREGSHTVLPRLTSSLSCSSATTTRRPRSTSWEALSVWWSCFRRSCSLEFPSSSRTCTMLTCLRRTSYLPGPRWRRWQGRWLGERVRRRRAQHGGGKRGPPWLPFHPLPPQQLQWLQPGLLTPQPAGATLWRQAEQHGGLQRRGVSDWLQGTRASPAWGENI